MFRSFLRHVNSLRGNLSVCFLQTSRQKLWGKAHQADHGVKPGGLHPEFRVWTELQKGKLRGLMSLEVFQYTSTQTATSLANVTCSGRRETWEKYLTVTV